MEIFTSLQSYNSGEDHKQDSDQFDYHSRTHEIIDAQLAFIVLLYACQVYGRVRYGPKFLRWQTMLMFAVEISTIYRSFTWILPKHELLHRIYKNFIMYPYLISHFAAYFYFAFKYWKSSKIIKLTTINKASQVGIQKAQRNLLIVQYISMTIVVLVAFILATTRIFKATNEYKEFWSLLT